jgi:hypothetical protein
MRILAVSDEEKKTWHEFNHFLVTHQSSYLSLRDKAMKMGWSAKEANELILQAMRIQL